MADLKKLQKEIVALKKERGFNTTDVEQDFCLTYGELSEAYNAYRKKLSDVGEELADVAIYLFGLAELLHLDLEKEILQKMEKNRKREYKKINGVYVRIKEG